MSTTLDLSIRARGVQFTQKHGFHYLVHGAIHLSLHLVRASIIPLIIQGVFYVMSQ